MWRGKGRETDMYSEDFVLFGFLALVAGIFFGMGFLIYVETGNEQQARLACITAGKSWIENSCVKVSP
jgi:formate/nitrite transporter FocA (FNT family)